MNQYSKPVGTADSCIPLLVSLEVTSLPSTSIPPQLWEETQQQGFHLLPLLPDTPSAFDGTQFGMERVVSFAILMLSPSN